MDKNWNWQKWKKTIKNKLNASKSTNLEADFFDEHQETQCPRCFKNVDTKVLENELWVCPHCEYHFRIGALKRLSYLVDHGSFKELFYQHLSGNPINFPQYEQKLTQAQQKTGLSEAIIVGKAKISNNPIYLAVMDFNFMGGSMGTVVGHRLTDIIEQAIKHNIPMLIVTASGGARMQEGIFSLMQMASTSFALEALSKAKLLCINLLTDPTYGGVTASFASLGDIILAEPGAMIGFSGTRVIEGTIKEKLPEGFQSSEFLLEHGFIDQIVHRKNLKVVVSQILDYHR